MTSTFKNIRTFIGAKNYAISRAFYKELGFEEVVLSEKMCLFRVNKELGFYLQDYYVKPKIVLSLQTKSPHAANQRARQLAQKLNEQWDLLKWRDLDNILSRFAIKQPTQSNAPTLSQAAQIYLQ